MSQLYDFKMKICSSLDATSAQNTFIAGSKLTELPSTSIYQVAGATFRQDANNGISRRCRNRDWTNAYEAWHPVKTATDQCRRLPLPPVNTQLSSCTLSWSRRLQRDLPGDGPSRAVRTANCWARLHCCSTVELS